MRLNFITTLQKQEPHNAEDGSQQLDKDTLEKAAKIAIEIEECIEKWAGFDKKKRDAKVRLIYIAL